MTLDELFNSQLAMPLSTDLYDDAYACIENDLFHSLYDSLFRRTFFTEYESLLMTRFLRDSNSVP